jgi:prepilin-type N-terminal cleavage/methylation domain-containing protein
MPIAAGRVRRAYPVRTLVSSIGFGEVAMRRFIPRGDAGFTLVEIVVVLAVAGAALLAARLVF